ncbi:alpha/beta fold hydrolase [Salinibacterium sp. NG253]|uniref:alpha/beta hydrolase n=1 Tax=Salinibacterium sp. NG253 TaxID=2792039 RepID=UPI0018CF8F1B|nr:alpha/beta hydrolase [Salinibacterium sp. NG253]MBH0117383.1 alpha/beta fold hydrolase [Salinibacterium sp. NG253]
MNFIAAAPASRARRFALVVPALVLTLVLSGCANLFSGLFGDTSQPTGEAVSAELAPYYEQILTWVDCDNGAQCATAIAPMDWANPSPETDIEIAMARQEATGESLGSLFVNPGGPGASGFDLIHDDVDFAVSTNLRENYDVIGWDPRGVGRSTPVTCLDDDGLDDFIFGIPAAAVGSDEWLAESEQAAIDFGQACLDNTGPILQFIDTQSTVHDLDMLRAIVGDEKLQYLGYSYGSDIGSYYIENFPQNVGRIVLDGATDSSISVFEVGRVQTIGFQRALENYLAACPTSFDDCPFTGGVDAALATIRELYDRYDANPIAAPDGRMMDAGVLDIAMSTALYSQDSWPFLNDLFSEAARGETDTAFFLADFYYSRDLDGSYTDNSLEAFIAIYCVDYPVETDPAVLVEQQELMREASPTTYRDFPPTGDLTCLNWPYQYIGPDITELTGEGAPPVLIISTTGDPATPYEWGVALSEQLESAQLITYNGEGHTAYNGGVGCIDGAVDAYFINGVVPNDDPDCAA